MFRESYAFHGVCVSVVTDSEVLADAIDGRLRLFKKTDAQPEVTITFSGADPVVRPQGTARPLYEIPGFEFSYFPASDQIFAQRRGVLDLVCDPIPGQARCSIDLKVEGAVWLASHVMFTLPLVEMLKRRGLFAVHAAGVAVDGRGFLFPGVTGSGKSTITISLIRAGMGFLGDDTVFVRDGPAGPRVHAFPDEIDLTDDTARLFPELSAIVGTVRPSGFPKHRVWPEAIYPADVIWECDPGILAFPSLAAGQETRIEPMRAEEALVELLPNVPLTDQMSSQAHLDALAGLVRSSHCYRLQLGRDPGDLPALVRELASR